MRGLTKSRLCLSLFVIACVCAASVFDASAQVRPADVIFRNGDVYTMNPRRPWAKAVAVEGKRIVYVGSNEGVARFKGRETKVVDLRGRMLMPGFIEGHIHPLMGAALTRGADLQYSRHDDLMDYLRTYARTAPDRGLIAGLVRGMGWRYSVFPASGPTRQELDEIWPDDPVMFTAVDGHSAWLNTKALDKVGKAITDADEGFRKDSAGVATGYVVEGQAMGKALGKLGPLSPEFISESLEDWLPKAAKAGITGVFDAGMAVVDEEGGFKIYTDLETRGKLSIRVVGSLLDNDPELDPLPKLIKLREEVDTELVQARVLKIIMDGTDANGSAAMLQPYKDDPDSSGKSVFTPWKIRRLIGQADAAGFDVHVHCIGDRAARETLNAIEAAIRENPRRNRRHTIAHNQLTDPADIGRFGRMRVIGQFSGQWLCMDGGYWKDVTVPHWGLERASREYRIGDIMRGGARVTLGTDWPAGSNSLVYEPLKAIQVVTTRRDWDNPDVVPLPTRENCLSLAEALRANTINAAYQIRLEDKVGSIETGKLADLIVLEKNLFKVDPEDIHKVQVDMTMMNGKFTHGGF